MAKYKAKSSYKKLDDSENFNAFSSSSKHRKLMNGQSVVITDIPEGLSEHLTKEGKPIKSPKLKENK
jgi:hypothetical protein